MDTNRGSSMALAEQPAPSFGAVEDDFSLDVRVVVAAHPVGKLMCNTGDGCGNTCQGSASACNSYVSDPV
ncbi:FxLD family lanthipeptide [Nocardiopsis sp. NRRL B-16309]|uniref:FxLD family lanthipeptide n=1 Tax=Nocardiopsis sp. NRRL B-16309 TaxID=1519494 RepID=UPI0006ADAE36|nr:FxLD family lanthipeptide [Nocardiopsis sp. NRRL B-16309]KOX23806.1 lantibiotic precursor [Nocardiopsis sp. NRRL B-16309]